MTDTLAKELKGLVVFGEHRYFGESFPFNKTDAFNDTDNIYLTIPQVMYDYVELVKYIRYHFAAMNNPCIVFGGSYGGMLAAWLRMKFPQTF
jgi:pimeloyl-ACP methyl ester carboxylesterase